MKNVFDDLYSLKDAAERWHLEESTIRKAILANRFHNGIEVKKFGKQWVISKEAMERVYGKLANNDVVSDYDDIKKEDAYYLMFECSNAYARKYSESIKKVNNDFKKNNIYEYIYECFDYLHLLSINENVKDIRSRIRRGIRFE